MANVDSKDMTPTVPPLIRKPAPLSSPDNKCSGCPDECGTLCTMTHSITEPCSLYAMDDAEDDMQKCSVKNCRDSYCHTPHSYFCNKNQEIDMSCTNEETAIKFLNSTNDICRNWYMGQCIESVANGHRNRPTRPMRHPVIEATTKEQTTELLPLEPVRPLVSKIEDICEPSCPEACGGFCKTVNLDNFKASPCLTIKSAEPACADTPCKSLYCSNPFAVFCTENNQIEWECTVKDENALMLLNSTGEECQQWFMSLCLSHRKKMTPPPIESRPETVKPDNIPILWRQKEICARDCPPQCGYLCEMVNSFFAPCSVADDQGGACPEERCHNFYCNSPFALFCTKDKEIDLSCTEEGAFAFINSTNDDCRKWIADQCKSKIEPVEFQEPLHPLAKRDATFRPCLDDCPVDECGVTLCRLTETVRAPCPRPGWGNYTSDECPAERCHNFYCGTPFPFYCSTDGSLDLECTQHKTALQFLNSDSAACTSWFMNQCKSSRLKGTSPDVSNRPSKLPWPFHTTITPGSPDVTPADLANLPTRQSRRLIRTTRTTTTTPVPLEDIEEPPSDEAEKSE